MRKFWQGMLWGGIVGSILGVMAVHKPQRKPLIRRSADAIKDTTDDLAKKARKTHRHMMRKVF